MEQVLGKTLARLVRRGTLEVTFASGARRKFGAGQDESEVAIRLTDPGAERALLLDPELRLGELFMDGRLVVERGSMYDFLRVLLQDNPGRRAVMPSPQRLARAVAHRIGLGNTLRRARRNAAHHYDLGEPLYDLFLDPARQYSCAYFERPEMSLEEAQQAKMRHIAAKLLVEPQHTVLDIGCGWGGLAMYLAEVADAAHVTGITLSKEQLGTAQRRAIARGLSDRVAFALQDYRKLEGCFDRIVSVGMFEHVGPRFYGTFFRRVRSLLAPDGVALLHTIGLAGGVGTSNPWVTRYIFPGGYLPALSQIAPQIERAGLFVTDVEVLRLHYAETLRAWRQRFLARREEAARLYDERFCRMWEFYLSLFEVAFRLEDLVVFQIQMSPRNDVVPITRDYIAARESELRRRREREARAEAEPADGKGRPSAALPERSSLPASPQRE